MTGLARIAGAVAAIAATAACGQGASAEGDALFLGDGEQKICVPMPADAGAGTIFGDGIIHNAADEAVTIRAVELVGADGMQLQDAYIVGVGSDGLVGIRHTTNQAPLPKAWETRVPAASATIPPGEVVNLVAVVLPDHTKTTVSGDHMLITYEDARGRRYHQETTTSFYISRDPCSEITAGG